MINTPVSAAPPLNPETETGFLAPSSSYDFSTTNKQHQRFQNNSYSEYETIPQQQHQNINFLPPSSNSASTPTQIASNSNNSSHLAASLSSYNNNNGISCGLPPASELLSPSINSFGNNKMQQKTGNSNNQQQQYSGLHAHKPSTSNNNSQQLLQMQVASPIIPPPSPYLNAPSVYNTLAEPGTPAFNNNSSSLIGSLTNFVDYNTGTHLAHSPVFPASLHSSNPASIMSSVPPESPSGSIASSAAPQRSPSIKSNHGGGNNMYHIIPTPTPSEFSNHSQNDFYNSQNSENFMYQNSEDGTNSYMFNQASTSNNDNFLNMATNPLPPTRTSKSYKSGRGQRNKNNMYTMLPIQPIRPPLILADNEITVKEHLQQVQAVHRQKVQQEMMNRRIMEETSEDKKQKRNGKNRHLNFSANSSNASSPQKNYFPFNHSLSQPNQISHSNSSSSLADLSEERYLKDLESNEYQSQNSINQQNHNAQKRRPNSINGTVTTNGGTNSSHFNKNMSNPQSSTSRYDTLASTIASVASGESGSFERGTSGDTEQAFIDHIDMDGLNNLEQQQQYSTTPYLNTQTQYANYGGHNRTNKRNGSTTVSQRLTQSFHGNMDNHGRNVYVVGQPNSTGDDQKYYETENQQKCRIHVQNLPNVIDYNFPPTETTIHVVQQTKNNVFFYL